MLGKLAAILKDPAHVMKQANHRGGNSRLLTAEEVVKAVQKESGILIVLPGSGSQPSQCQFAIFLDVFPHEVQFPKSILGILVSSFGRDGQVSDSSFYIFGNVFAGEVQLSKAVVSVLVIRFLIPLNGFADLSLSLKEFAESVLRIVVPGFC